MSVYNANLDGWVCKCSRERECWILAHNDSIRSPVNNVHSKRRSCITYLVIVPSHNVHIWRDRAQIIIGLLVTDITCAYYLLDFTGHEEFLELCGEVVRSMGDMKVAYDED